MSKTRTARRLRLERETLTTLHGATLEDIVGGTPVAWTTTCPPSGPRSVPGKLSDVLTRVPGPYQIPGRITDLLTRPRVGTCFCPPRQ